MRRRVFLLSPAQCGGKRAELLRNPRAQFDLAVRLRAAAGATIGEVMAFLSGLYFRGKAAYVQAFANPPAGCEAALVITPNAGLWPLDQPMDLHTLESFAGVDVDCREHRFVVPFHAGAEGLRESLGRSDEIVLLGSFATTKYSAILLPLFARRLLVPRLFVGRGDMSRGALMLEAARLGRELGYVSLLEVTKGSASPGFRPSRP